MATAISTPRVDFRPRNVYGVWLRHWLAFKAGWLVDSSAIVIEPVFILLAVGFGIGRFVENISEGLTYQEFVAPGIIAANAMWPALFNCSWGAYQRMENHKVYETMISAPVNLSELAAGEIVWGATRSLMTTAAVLTIAAMLGLIDSPLAILILPVGVLIGLVFGGMGLIYASIAPSQHSMMLIFTLIGTPIFFFSGAFFPIDSLHSAVQPIAWVMPLTGGVHAARGLATGDFGLGEVFGLLYLGGLAVTFYPIAFLLLRRKLVL
ncbi:MAG: ABC transporter permease [Chloroflexi bacterium]|nr:ABC transporter permease [Chloroflexota bacterium]MCH8222986.1 ABC transporter permease [Chloroflexota bacterium]